MTATLALLLTLTAQAQPGALGPEAGPTDAASLPELPTGPGTRTDGPTAPGPEAIVNGKEESGFPQTVAVGAAGFSACTASVIAPRVILTAGHCGDGLPTELVVEFGVAMFGPEATMQAESIGFVDFAIHPDYVPLGTTLPQTLPEFDLALLELESDAPVDPIRYRTRPFSDDDLGATVTSVGFGITSSAGAGGGTKRSAKLTVDEIDDMFVLSDVSTNKDGANICSGDSGGPQYYKDKVTGEWEQWAVHSWGDQNCLFNSGSTRTDIAADWIGDFIEEVHGTRDYCEFTGRYGDGTCDRTCDQIDPDCLPTVAQLEAVPGGCDHSRSPLMLGWLVLPLLGLRRRR